MTRVGKIIDWPVPQFEMTTEEKCVHCGKVTKFWLQYDPGDDAPKFCRPSHFYEYYTKSNREHTAKLLGKDLT